MTISTPVSRVDVLGNGSATSFSFSPVIITAASDLQVWMLDPSGNITALTQGSAPGQYVVVVPAYPGTGSVTYPGPGGGTTLPTGWKLTIKQRAPLTQQFQPQNQGPFLAGTYGNAYDYATMNALNLQEQVSRAPLAAETDLGNGLIFPTITQRRNQLLGFDGNGNMIATQPSNAPVSVAMQPVVAATTLALARTALGVVPGAVIITPQQYGAVGDGSHDDTTAIQNAINAAAAVNGAVYMQAVSVGYKITSPLNCANLTQLRIYGDGCYPGLARITPTGGSVIIGATGTGHCFIDASGSSSVVIQGITLASIGIGGASTIGIYYGQSNATSTNSSCVLDEVSIMLPDTGATVGVYGVSCNLLQCRGLIVMSDYCVILTDTTANALSLNPPYGVWGANVQSDDCCFVACVFYAYGTTVPLWLINCTCTRLYQQYIANINGGIGYTGQAYAMNINGCTDLTADVGIDYFPCAVVQWGIWKDVRLDGIIFQWTTPLPANVPTICSYQGNGVFGGRVMIRGLTLAASNYAYGSSNHTTFAELMDCDLMFDTAINTVNVMYFDFPSTNPVVMWNVRMHGNTDLAAGTAAMTIDVNGSPAATSTYRLWMNGLRLGVA